MGKIKTGKEFNYKKAIIVAIAVTGLLAVAMLAPNILQAFGYFFRKKKYSAKYYINKKLSLLIKQGFIRVRIIEEKRNLELTKKGKKQLQYYQVFDKSLKNRKWDGRWRVVIFDVWEKARGERDLLRKEIKEFGFIRLQQSVWIYPYECRAYIELLKTDLSFGKNIRYMVVESIDNDTHLREYFHLI